MRSYEQVNFTKVVLLLNILAEMLLAGHHYGFVNLFYSLVFSLYQKNSHSFNKNVMYISLLS